MLFVKCIHTKAKKTLLILFVIVIFTLSSLSQHSRLGNPFWFVLDDVAVVVVVVVIESTFGHL